MNDELVNRAKTCRVSCKEENPSCKPSTIPEDESSPEGWTTHEVSKNEFDSLMEAANANFPVESQWHTTLQKVKSYLDLEAGWDMNCECPAPVQESVFGAAVFMARMFRRNPSLITGVREADPIGAPVAVLDHEGIVSLIWSVERGGTYISFAFYPEKEVIGYYWFKDGSSAFPANLDDEDHLNQAFALIQKYGGGADAVG